MSESVIVDERFSSEEETHLTVHRTSMFFPGDGFVVYDDSGEVIFRVDSCGLDSQPKDEHVLMDSSGKSLVTLIRKSDYGPSTRLLVVLLVVISQEKSWLKSKEKVDPDTNVVSGEDVLLLCVKPGIDGAFVMELVLVLDNMDWHEIHNRFMGNGPS